MSKTTYTATSPSGESEGVCRICGEGYERYADDFEYVCPNCEQETRQMSTDPYRDLREAVEAALACAEQDLWSSTADNDELTEHFRQRVQNLTVVSEVLNKTEGMS